MDGVHSYLAQPPDERSPAQLKDGLDGVLQQERVYRGGGKAELKRKKNATILKRSGAAVSSAF